MAVSGAWLGVFQRLVGCGGDGGARVRLHSVQFLRGLDAGPDQEAARLADGVAAVLRGALGRGPVRGLVVRTGVGVRADGMRVQKRRAFSLPAPLNHLSRGTVAVDEIGAVALHDLQPGEAGEQPGDVASSGLHLDRDRDGVLVVLDDEKDRELEVTGGVEGFPELAFRGGSVTGGANDDFVVRERGDVPAEPRQVGGAESGLGGAHGVEELGAGG